jgi:feruloyl esterase
VVGRIDERTGEDGKPYAIGFRLRLPTAWNGRFLFQGGGGTDGNLGNALGSTGVGQTTNALSLGYAVVSTDAGHANERVPFVGGTLFGLERFRRSDGKLIIYHGAADPVFSLNDTIRAYGPALNGAPDTARLFVVPGMNHCAGGPATDQFDVLTPLIRWVEDGVPPDSIPGTANPGSPWPGRTRPLCPYPRVATYIGSGDAEDAANFVCAAPAR